MNFRINRFVMDFGIAILLGGLLFAVREAGLLTPDGLIHVNAAPFTPGPYDTVPPSPTSMPPPTSMPTSTKTFTPLPRTLPPSATNTRLYWTKTPTFTPSYTASQPATGTLASQAVVRTNTMKTETKTSTPTRTGRTPAPSSSATAFPVTVGLEKGNHGFQILLLGIGAGIILLAMIYLRVAFLELRRAFGDKLSIYTIGLVLLLIGLGVVLILLGAMI